MPNTPRIVPGSNQDVTSRVLTNDYQSPAFAAILNPIITAARTVIGPISVAAAVPAPGIPTLVGSTTGGALAAATYFYKITALNTVGESLGSPEASVVTTGATSSVAISWPAIAGATSYKIYRGTAAGAENTYYTSTTNSFTDTGAAGTAGTVPTTTGQIAVNPGIANSYIGDELVILFTNPQLSASVVTLGANVATIGTLTVASNKKGSIYCVFDGLGWVETGRAATI